jgi:molybdenum cofactor cytidylyltransferase
MSGICAIILAAGESRRMGFPKMLLEFNGVPMIECVIRNVKSSEVNDIIVVLGANSDQVKPITDRTGVACCYNEIYIEGMLSSVQCGLRSINPDYDAALFFQGDQPFISSDVINKVIDAYYKSGKGIVMPVYNKRRGHPLLVDRKYFREIEKLDPEKGLKSLSKIFSDYVEEVSVSEAGILRDFDTFEDYRNEINQIH